MLSGNLGRHFGADTVSHNATVDNGPGNTVVKANTVFGTLGCTGNNPPPPNAAQPNTGGADPAGVPVSRPPARSARCRRQR